MHLHAYRRSLPTQWLNALPPWRVKKDTNMFMHSRPLQPEKLGADSVYANQTRTSESGKAEKGGAGEPTRTRRRANSGPAKGHCHARDMAASAAVGNQAGTAPRQKKRAGKAARNRQPQVHRMFNSYCTGIAITIVMSIMHRSI